MSINPLNEISKVYLEQIAESAVPGKPAEKVGALTNIDIPKAEQDAARERTLAKAAAMREKKGIAKESLDPVGQEDDDIDNDGKKNTKTDKYLLNRRKAIGKAISTQKEAVDQDGDGDNDFADVMIARMTASGKKSKKQAISATKNKSYNKESFSNWRNELKEIANVVTKEQNPEQIKEKKVNNKIKINPTLSLNTGMVGSFKESVENLGGTLLEMVELDEAEKWIQKAIKKPGALHKQLGVPEGEKIPAGKLAAAAKKGGKLGQRARFAQTLKGLKKEEMNLDEKTLTSLETKKKEEIVKSMKSKLNDFETRYPGRGKEVMYATATKMAKKVAEQAMELKPKTQQPKPQQSQVQKPDPAIQAKQQQAIAIQKQIELKKVQLLSKGVPLTQTEESSAADAVAAVKGNIIKQHGAKAIVGTPEQQAATAARAASASQKPKPPLQGYRRLGTSGTFNKSDVD